MSSRGFYFKVICIIIMTALILSGLIYLMVNDNRNTHHEQRPDAVSTVSPSASASVQTKEPAETLQPSISPETSVEPTAETTPDTVDVTSDDSLTRIVNQNHKLSADYQPSDLVTVNVSQYGTQQLRKEAADALVQMFSAAKQDGISLYLISGYRDYAEQTSLYYTYEERFGKDYADSIDDRPGESEHQLGLAADIGTEDGNCQLDACFMNTEAYQWLQANADQYGYILRYPDGKEDVTGVIYSPWNYRYVGVQQAQKIKASGLTMEEYYNRF